MPDSNIADGSVLTSSFYNTYIREQVVVTCTAATRPTGVEGRIIFETDTNKLYIYNGSAWNLLGGSGWTSYTPSWTNLTVGNGTQSAAYRYADGGMWVRGAITFGSTSSISGDVSQVIPNSETSTGDNIAPVGMVTLSDTGTAAYSGVARLGSSLTSVVFRYWGTTANNTALSSTAPFTWTTNDVITWQYFAPL